MAWKDSDRVLETPRGFAGEGGADLIGLNPGGTFHTSCNIFEKTQFSISFLVYCSDVKKMKKDLWTVKNGEGEERDLKRKE